MGNKYSTPEQRDGLLEWHRLQIHKPRQNAAVACVCHVFEMSDQARRTGVSWAARSWAKW